MELLSIQVKQHQPRLSTGNPNQQPRVRLIADNRATLTQLQQHQTDGQNNLNQAVRSKLTKKNSQPLSDGSKQNDEHQEEQTTRIDDNTQREPQVVQLNDQSKQQPKQPKHLQQQQLAAMQQQQKQYSEFTNVQLNQKSFRQKNSLKVITTQCLGIEQNRDVEARPTCSSLLRESKIKIPHNKNQKPNDGLQQQQPSSKVSSINGMQNYKSVLNDERGLDQVSKLHIVSQQQQQQYQSQQNQQQFNQHKQQPYFQQQEQQQQQSSQQLSQVTSPTVVFRGQLSNKKEDSQAQQISHQQQKFGNNRYSKTNENPQSSSQGCNSQRQYENLSPRQKSITQKEFRSQTTVKREQSLKYIEQNSGNVGIRQYQTRDFIPLEDNDGSDGFFLYVGGNGTTGCREPNKNNFFSSTLKAVTSKFSTPVKSILKQQGPIRQTNFKQSDEYLTQIVKYQTEQSAHKKGSLQQLQQPHQLQYQQPFSNQQTSSSLYQSSGPGG
ncbi:UNKNOWN [Stylonychia lemnae]|uniref:Uncharacterized protein n=1 Tax=Stylonychia lemnae TaxID=5949 RepID=A0A078AB08_STYLE|nr:UNKNOWN [Stylonychia lemnae]|eukprot:CDW78792.1 UNKNOWN [Stylonychia lemnae]